MKLSEAAVGSRVKVVSVNFPPSLQNRILGLGFVPGATVEVVREAPLGDPKVYLVHGKFITLRSSEASMIEVEPIDKKFPLSMATIGRRYRIVSFAGGSFFLSRVKALGLREDMEILVEDKFPMTILAGGRRIKLGMGMAEKILVEEIDRGIGGGTGR